MAKIDEYRQYVRQILTEYSNHKPAYGDVEVETIFDTERDRYQVVSAGWKKKPSEPSRFIVRDTPSQAKPLP